MAQKRNKKKKDLSSVNKAAYLRYLIIDECLSNRTWGGWTKMEMLEKLANPYSQVRRQSEGDIYYKEASRKGLRQLEYDLEDMFYVHGLLAEEYLQKEKEGRLVRYSYKDPKFSLRNKPISSTEALHLNSVLEMLSRLKGLPQQKWIDESIANLKSLYKIEINNSLSVVEYDNADYMDNTKLETFYGPLYDAIVGRRVIKVRWISFKDGEQEDSIHPYMLKQYNHRWYIIGKSEREKNKGKDIIYNVPLDRMIPYSNEEVIGYNSKVQYEIYDIEEFYYNLVGVTFTEEGPQKVRLKVSDALRPYVESKTIHGTQTKIDENNTFTITVHINYELKSLLRSHGVGLEILEPLSLREEMRKEFEELVSKYK